MEGIMNTARTLMLGGSFLAIAIPLAAYGQEVAPAAPSESAGSSDSAVQDAGVQDIVVTAQKRSESASRVGMSITALQGDKLIQAGITDQSDLQKVVSGLTVSQTSKSTPIYTVRGIGFDEPTLGSNSTVALYVDEVPIPYPVEARFATLDLARVEVLKGPQGILFGQNSTAGAINFIAAKPTNTFEAGFNGTYGRFDLIDVSGFVSGPITDTLKVRASAQVVHSGGWQKSYTRDDTLGAKRQFAGRFLATWQPTDELTINLNVNGWRDRSDTQAGQLLKPYPLIPSAVNPDYDAYPLPPQNDRVADWDPNTEFRRNDSFFQASGRIDYAITPDVTFTSITALTRFKQNYRQDVDASALPVYSTSNTGHAHSINEEVRLAGAFGGLHVIVGGNYERDNTFDQAFYHSPNASVFYALFGNTDSISFADQHVRTYAVFGNADYAFGRFTLHGGLRYTNDRRDFSGCIRDGGNGTNAQAFNFLLGLSAPNLIQPGECVTSLNRIPGLVVDTLAEHNVSWRAGVDYQAANNVLLYTNVSRGYKAGAFPNINAADATQMLPATQESVLAYEGGIKAGLFSRKLQINAAGFYYDYSDKQLQGRQLDKLGVFGVLSYLLNVPKSRAYGFELQVQSAPVRGLTLNGSATYVKTKVLSHFLAYDPVGNLLDYKGLPFPNTPLWTVTAAADYERPVSDGVKAFIGTNITYHSKTSSLFQVPSMIAQAEPNPVLHPGETFPADTFVVKAYNTIDARIGIASSDDKWRAWLWGKNIFNTHYWTTATTTLDSAYRLTGMPATYGASVSLRF
jgi:iron complex outermembrane receptor protein